MSRLIDADALELFIKTARSALFLDKTLKDIQTRDEMLLNFQQYVHLQPTIGPVGKGAWLNIMEDFSTAECDKCGEIYEVTPDETPGEDYYNAFKHFYKFCPSCGAKMDGGHHA